ncbi:hypothetical protein [Verrucomicrobium sp. 3C]|uniref:hypothetical protein n=1 Tax=Verrucomicrobium sp. 3C TaxID=1134055 RepID=UPI0003A8515B|nr:hypothetical protein [Verrucomicrobium sp. 3C]
MSRDQGHIAQWRGSQPGRQLLLQPEAAVAAAGVSPSGRSLWEKTREAGEPSKQDLY